MLLLLVASVGAADWSFATGQADALGGYALAGVGDVDADGFSDVLVGAYGHDGAVANEGATFLFRGSASGLSARASATFTSGQASSMYAYAVGPAGDVDADGYDDALVGASAWDAAEPDVGAVLLYFGGPEGLGAAPGWRVEGDQREADFGFRARTAGDVNADGHADLLVGALRRDETAADAGRAYLYLGGPDGPDATPSWSFTSDQERAFEGRAVASAGDVDADGHDDVVVSAHWYDGSHVNEGRVDLFLGGSAGLGGAPAWTVYGGEEGSILGYVLAGGDVDADGHSDVLVGAIGVDGAVADSGAAFLFGGTTSGLSPVAVWSADTAQTGAYAGTSVALGDVDADGFADVLVGAHQHDAGQTNEGRVALYRGGPDGPERAPSWTAESDQADAFFGWSAAFAGDVDGDGFGDLLVGGYGWDDSATDEGAAWMFRGGPDGPVQVPDAAVYADADGDGFGSAASSMEAHDPPPPGWVLDASDCDDASSAVNPSAPETCNAVDDDCDGEVDEDAPTWFPDADGDGHATPDGAVTACEGPPGHASEPGADCDDADPTTHPGAADPPDDGVDQDCDGADAAGAANGAEPCGCASAGAGASPWTAWLVLASVLRARRVSASRYGRGARR